MTPPGSNRPIRDDEGEAHGTIALAEAMTHSCNQYFAQLGVEVDRERMGAAAGRFGLRVFDDPVSSLRAGSTRNLWNTEDQILSDVLAPLNLRFRLRAKGDEIRSRARIDRARLCTVDALADGDGRRLGR